MDILSAIMKWISPPQSIGEKELEVLAKKAEVLEHDASLTEQKAALVGRINKAKGSIAESQAKMKGTPSAYGGLMNKKKVILWAVLTAAAFVLIKFMGC